jgi:hypothetical protein
MAFVDDIDFHKTISKHKLVLKTKWLDVNDSCVFLIAAISFIGYIVFTFKEADFNNPNDKAHAFVGR